MKTKSVKTLKALKRKLKKELPRQISKVINSYEDFSAREAPEDAKGFSAHHNACKSAVVHAETLLKLTRWTEGEEVAAAVPGESLEQLLAEAREAAESFADEND